MLPFNDVFSACTSFFFVSGSSICILYGLSHNSNYLTCSGLFRVINVGGWMMNNIMMKGDRRVKDGEEMWDVICDGDLRWLQYVSKYLDFVCC